MKAGFLYTLLLLGFISLLIFSNHSNQHHSGHRRHRRLLIRKHSSNSSSSSSSSNWTGTDKQHHEQAAFDPLLAEMEWKRENRDWEREYFGEQYRLWNSNSTFETGSGDHHHQNHVDNDHGHHHKLENDHGDHHHHAVGDEHQPVPDDDDYNYINEDMFNISQRLEALFPELDVNPKDNVVSLKELQDWHVVQNQKLAKKRAEREFEVRDKNHDGLVSFQEYLPHLFIDGHDNDTSNMEHGHAGWWKEHFDLADADGNGGLNHTEFFDFLHPEDSKNPKLHVWLRKEQIKSNDHDNDGKLSLTEFDHVYDMVKYYGTDLTHLHQGNDADARKRMFDDLDKNKDGFLTEDELEPIMDKLHPNEAFYAKHHAEGLINQADTNKDGVLTLAEMLEHPYAFYSTAYSPEEDEYAEYHDEFR